MVSVEEATGIQGHTGFIKKLNSFIDKHKPVGIIQFDIDAFLRINKDLGRETGDKLLTSIAELAIEIAGKFNGYAFRTSGDEFDVLIPEISLEEAFLRAEDIRKLIEESQGRYGLEDGYFITATFGVAQYPRNSKTTEGLIRAACAAMYAAKESGRNKVALPPDEDMVMKSCYYSSTSITLLKQLANKLEKSESELLREALDSLLRYYDK